MVDLGGVKHAVHVWAATDLLWVLRVEVPGRRADEPDGKGAGEQVRVRDLGGRRLDRRL